MTRPTAEGESRKISKRAKSGKAARAKAGRLNCSITPYGYEREKVAEKTWKDPEPDPETSPVVVLAFESYATGEHSDQDIADLLNRDGYPPSGWKAARWEKA